VARAEHSSALREPRRSIRR